MVKKMENFATPKNNFVPPQFDGVKLEARLEKALRGNSPEDFREAIELLSLATYYEVKLPNLDKRQAFDKLEKVWPLLQRHRPDLKDIWHFLASKWLRNYSAAAEHSRIYAMSIFSNDFKILVEKYSMLKTA